MIPLSFAMVGPPDTSPPRVPVRPMVGYTFSVFFYTLVFSLLTRVDILLLKALGMDLVSGSASSKADYASILAADYGTAKVFAILVQQLLNAVAMVVFPMVARSESNKDRAASRRVVKRSFRIALLLTGLSSAILAAMPGSVISIVYNDAFSRGALSLRHLSWGYGLFALIVMGCTILNSTGETRKPIIVMISVLLCMVAGNTAALKMSADASQALAWTALSTSAAMGVGFLLTAFMVFRAFGVLCDGLTACRVLAAGAATFLVGVHLPPWGRAGSVLQCLLLVGVYMGLLFALHELTMKDMREVMGILRPKSRKRR